MEQQYFDGEAAAFRTKLTGNLKLNENSAESQALLRVWSERGKKLIEEGVIDRFHWDLEEAAIWYEAGIPEHAIYVLKAALVEAIHQADNEKRILLESQIRKIGGDPEDLDDFYGS